MAANDAKNTVEPNAPQEPVAAAETPREAEVGELPLAQFDLGPSSAASVALPELGGAPVAAAARNYGLLLDVGVEVAAVVGTRELKLEQVLSIQPGAIIDLDRQAGEPIELYVNGKPIALAEIVVVDGRLGARVVETLASPLPRS